MASKPVSRSAFAAPGQPSLADLIARVEAAPDLPKITRQNWCWALRTVAPVARKAPPAPPPHPPAFRARAAERAPPRQPGPGPGRLEQRKVPAGQGDGLGGADQRPRPLPGALYAGMEQALAAAAAQVGAGGPAHPPVSLL